MRSLPQVDLPQPAPAQLDTGNRQSGRGDSDDFSAALHRSTAAEHQSKANDHREETTNASPRPKPVEDEPTKTTSERAQPKENADTSSAARDEATVPDSEVDVPVDLAGVLILPAPQPVIDASVDPTLTLDGDPLALLSATTSESELLSKQATVPTLEQPTAAVALMAGPGLASATSGDKPATADVSQIASSLPATAAMATPVIKNLNNQAANADAVSADALDVNVAELPVMVAGLALTKVVSAAEKSAPLSPATADDSATAPTSAVPLTSATPANQPTAMHAIAAAIGDHESKDAPAKDSSTVTVKAATGDLATGSTPQAPTTTTTAVKPLSETVLAQNTLAQNGNAMEKAVSHQVTKALVQHLPNGDRMMVLRLTPPELGTVKIEVVERQGVFSARIHAEDDGVRLALERFLPSMRQDLRASDAPIRELTLSDQAQFQRSFADGQQSNQQDARQSGNRRQGDDAPRFSLDGVSSEPLAIPVTAALGGRIGQSWVDARA